MRFKKVIALAMAVSMVSAFSITANAELAGSESGGNVTISTIPTKAELEARTTSVTTTVKQLTEADTNMPGMGLYDGDFNDIDVFSSEYKVYKIENTFAVGDVASKMDALYCGVYSISTTYNITAEQKDNIFTDDWGTVGIKSTVDGDLMTANAGVDGTNLNMFATSSGTVGTKIYPGAGKYITDAKVTQTTYVVLKATAPSITLNNTKAEIVYYAKRGANAVENVKNAPTATASITLGTPAVEKKTVTLIVDGKEYQKDTVEKGKSYTLPTPTKEGFAFSGWNTAADFTGITVSGTIDAINADVTYYGKFTAIVYDPEVTVGERADSTTTGKDKAFAWLMTIKHFDADWTYTGQFVSGGESRDLSFDFSGVTGEADVNRIVILHDYHGTIDPTFTATATK